MPKGTLWELQKRRRAEALPLAALQLTAEAAARGIPTLLVFKGGQVVESVVGAQVTKDQLSTIIEKHL